MKPFYYLCDFPERKNVGKNYLACVLNAARNTFRFPARRDFTIVSMPDVIFMGRLKDFWEERPLSAGRAYGGPPGFFPCIGGKEERKCGVGG